MDIDSAFEAFLFAYNRDDYGKVVSSSLSEGDRNAIFGRYASYFNAWLKIPEWMRTKYNNHVPQKLIEAARNDPNFTEDKAVMAEQKYLSQNDPNSLNNASSDDTSLENALMGHPYVSDLAALGVVLDAAQIKHAETRSQEIILKGYSQKASNILAISEEYVKKLDDKEEEIKNNPNLTEDEKRSQIQELRGERYKQTEYGLDALKEDLKESQPERALVRLMHEVNAGKVKKEDAMPLMTDYLNRVSKMDRSEKLYEQFKTSKFRRLKLETKEMLFDLMSQQITDSKLETQSQGEITEQIKKLQDARQSALQDEHYKQKKQALNIAKAELVQTMPERALVRLMREVNAGKVKKEDALPLMTDYLNRVSKQGRIKKLHEQIESPMFKLLKLETKKILFDLTSQQIIDNRLEKVRDRLVKTTNEPARKYTPQENITYAGSTRTYS